MASLQSTVMGSPTPFDKSIRVEKVDSNAYKLHLNEGFCIGSVPNGGYTAAYLLSAAKAHLESLNLPGDALVAHFEYPSRTAAGPAIVIIDEVKLGKQLSLLHLTLWQDGLLPQAPWITPGVSRRALLAYSRHADLPNFRGMSISTPRVGPDLPLPDFDALKARGADAVWEAQKVPRSAAFARALSNWHIYLPRSAPSAPGVLDMWMRLASGEPLTQASLAYVIDSYPYSLHSWLASPGTGPLWKPAKGSAQEQQQSSQQQQQQQQETDGREKMWFPTLSLSLEAKMALPPQGVEWLSMRVISKQIKDGRFDLEALVRDVDGNYVALGHQVAMVLSMDRNTGGRRPEPKPVL